MRASGRTNDAPRLPTPESVELGDQCEKMVGGRVQVRRERGDLVPEVEENVRLVVDRVAGCLLRVAGCLLG